LQYLQATPKFDTVAQIVKLAGLEDVFTNEEITFFAPTDEVIRRNIGLVNTNLPYLGGGLNQRLFDAKKDTIRVLADVPSAIWRKFLMRYMFKGKNVLKDYPQIDFDLRPLYPGGFYYGYNNDLANVGVVYNSTNGVAYNGYRQLYISYIPDPSNKDSFILAPVASSDIQPKNGVVHALAVTDFHQFGFNDDFKRDVLLSR
jgi:hypothetical protein